MLLSEILTAMLLEFCLPRIQFYEFLKIPIQLYYSIDAIFALDYNKLIECSSRTFNFSQFQKVQYNITAGGKLKFLATIVHPIFVFRFMKVQLAAFVRFLSIFG